MFEDISIVVFPELIGPAIHNKEFDLLVAYLVAKTLDKECNNSTGVITLKMLMNVFHQVLGVKKAQAYKRIEKGIGVYWHKPGGKNFRDKKVGLKRVNAIWKYLKPTMLRSKPFCIPFQDFNNNTGHTNRIYLQNMFISCIASRHGDFRPQSLTSISKEARVSYKTAQRALKEAVIMKQCNFQSHYVTNDLSKAVAVKNQLQLESNGKLWVYRGNKQFEVVSQIGNSYTCSYDRMSIRTRPDYAKVLDSINRPNEINYKYVTSEKKIKKKQYGNDSLIAYCDADFPKLSKVRMWKSYGDNLEPVFNEASKPKSATEIFQNSMALN
jgi:hypothetical protein